jgi:hypothetical protein
MNLSVLCKALHYIHIRRVLSKIEPILSLFDFAVFLHEAFRGFSETSSISGTPLKYYLILSQTPLNLFSTKA